MDTYEKKYNEALERFKSFKEKYYTKDTNLGDVIFDKTGKMQKDFEDIFPQLRESEEERIRQKLIEFLREAYSKGNAPEECAKWIVWLDQPKEQKTVLTAKEAWKEMRLEVYAQASGNRHEPNYSDDSTKMFSLCDIDEIFEKIGNSTVGSQPAEWSEEDERIVIGIYAILEAWDRSHTAPGGIPSLIPEYCLWLENRLKSLRPRPSWKPNEEQMRALNEIICLGEISYVGQEEELIALRNKLKKLM